MIVYAAVYAGPRNMRIEDVPALEPGPGEVQIEVAYTGICGTDLHIFHGDMDARVGGRAVLGHEMSGRVAALGAGVGGWSVGDPVTVMPTQWCGECPACRAGHRHICERLRFLGIDAAGSMQNRWTLPADRLVAVPPELPLTEAALVEPVAVAVHDVRRAGLRPGETALVVGGGPVGLLIAAVSARAGADVLVVEPNPHRRRLAEAFGLATADPADTDVPAVVQDWTSGAGAQVAFEVSGAAAGVDAAVAALSARGRLVLVAIHSVRRPVDLHRFFWRELTLIGVRLYERGDFESAVELVASRQLPLADLISRVLPLHRVGEAFAALDGGDAVMKVLIDCQAAPAPGGPEDGAAGAGLPA
jgi:(R,R)-butanediol dehydrogenase / meso-butanediol dehydrogenase / diacetyl reductase